MIPTIIALVLMGGCWLIIGYALGHGRKTPVATQDINAYINEKFPDRWAAYKQGVHEGYEAGLRDGQDIHELT